MKKTWILMSILILILCTSCGPQVELENECRTKYAEVNMVSAPTFLIQYPANWSIVEETLNRDYIGETITLENDRGVRVYYANLSVAEVKEYGRVMYKMDISEETESSFVPGYVSGTQYASLGKFVVAKVQVTGSLCMDTDTRYQDSEGAVMFAVLPKRLVGTQSEVRNCGYYNGFSLFYFDYATPYALFATAPEGKFTEQEEAEVVAILSSFREVQE